MLNIYITRHGETEWNTLKKAQGHLDSPLTEKGKSCAQALSRALSTVSFEAVYSSPSKRALDTAHLICGERTLEIIPDKLLMEINLGDWEGRTFDEAEADNKTQFDYFWKSPEQYCPERGESFHDVYERAKKILNRVVSSHANGNVLLVTHAGFLKTLITLVKKAPISTIWTGPHIHGTSLTKLEYDQEEYKIILEGDVSHLGDEPLLRSY